MRKIYRRTLTLLLTAAMLSGYTLQASAAGPLGKPVSQPEVSAETHSSGPMSGPMSGPISGPMSGSSSSQASGIPKPEATSGPLGPLNTSPAPEETEQPAAEQPAPQPANNLASLAEDVQEIIGSTLVSLTMLQPDLTWTPVIYTPSGVMTTNNQGFMTMSLYIHSLPGDIQYRTYTSSTGWTNWSINGDHTAWNQGVLVEAVQIRLESIPADYYDIYYAATLSDGTVCDWARNGATSGTMASGKYIAGMQIALYPKGTGPAANTAKSVSAPAYEGISFNGGAPTYSSGTGQPFTGWLWYDNTTRYYFVDGNAVTGWQSIDGYRYYFEADGRLVTDLEPYLNSGGPFYLRINKQMNCITVYIQDEEGNYTIPYKAFRCSTGDDTPIGTFRTPEKYRWQLMVTGEYCQFCTRLGSGLHILMHSVIYETNNPYTLKNTTYNYLGYSRSHGCIRLLTRDARWIYEHCPLGTTVNVYESSIPGPFDRPGIPEFITDSQTWDPTDVEVPENGLQ